MATNQGGQAKAAAIKGALIGFTVLGTLVGWAQMSSAALMNPTSVASAVERAATPGTAAPASPNTTALNTTGALRTVRAAPAPVTRSRSSR
ncbi:MAG: hypothetical protein HZB53_17270 [Chloroflexi bacterium]|nr:hypothetical protein [Chloroflexota bacterium]